MKLFLFRKLFLFFFLFFFFPVSTVFAQTAVFRTRISNDTVKKGATFTSVDAQFQVGIAPEGISQRKRINFYIKPITTDSVDLTGENLVSNLYAFNIYAKKTVEIKKSIKLILKYNQQDDDYKRVFKYWDNNKQQWIKLPAHDNKDTWQIDANIGLPYAIVGVFAKQKNYQTGYASWYDYDGAASTKYPYGSIVKVVNLSNNKSCQVKILDYGPFVEGRVIDLPRDKFSEIADLGEGVVRVKVIPIYIP